MSPSRKLERALARDLDGAFPELVRRHQNGLYAGALRFTGNAEDARDVTQEAFVRAYRALDGYDAARIHEIQLGAWLWTIAANLCRNHARAAARRPRSRPLDSAGEPAAPTVDGSTGPAIEAALACLPERQRLAVVMRHVADVPVEDIAIALDRPVGTIKSDIHRGLATLRRVLTEEEI